MPNPKLTIRLVGQDEDNGIVRFDDFRTFCDRVSECLRRAEKAVTQKVGKIRYRVADLHSSSAVVTLEAIPPKSQKTPDKRAEVIDFFTRTVADLQVGTKFDPRLTVDDLVGFRNILAPLKRTKEVRIESVQLTTQYIANIDKILATPIRTEGAVSGFLEGLNVHNKNEFVLYPPLSGYRIVCSFQPAVFEQVRSAIKRNVTVSGTLFYHPDRIFPDRVQVRELEVHPLNEDLPTLRELRGTFQGCTNGLTSVDFVRQLRDEHPCQD